MISVEEKIHSLIHTKNGIFIHVGKYNMRNQNFFQTLKYFHDWKFFNIEVLSQKQNQNNNIIKNENQIIVKSYFQLKQLFSSFTKINYLFLDSNLLNKIYDFLQSTIKLEIDVISFIIDENSLFQEFIPKIIELLQLKNYIFFDVNENNLYYFVEKKLFI